MEGQIEVTPGDVMGVFLCRCNGKVSSALPMDELRLFLENMRPGLRVVICDDLCKAAVLREIIREQNLKPAVIGGCSGLRSGPGFWEDPDSCVLDPESVGIVDLAREAGSPYSSEERIERVKALLRAKVRRQERFGGIPQNARKVHFARPQGEMSRRDLVNSVLPKYRVAPYVDSNRCAGERCRICRQACDSDAITIDGRQVSIDIAKCQGCGACAAVCPRQAIVYPNHSLDQLQAEIGGLLVTEGTRLSSRIIAVICQGASQRWDEVENFHLPPNVLPLEVPCLATFPGWLMLSAFGLGAQGLVLVHDKGKCSLKVEEKKWRGTAAFVQGVLQELGAGPGRVRVIEFGDLPAELPRFCDVVAGLEPIPAPSGEQAGISDEAWTPATPILGLAEHLNRSLEGTVSRGEVPFGKLTLNKRRCTACGVCAGECPARALTMVSAGSLLKLVFRHESCVGCGQCAEICPERGLKVEKVLDLACLEAEPEVLFEGDFVRCVWCGAPFAPRSMFEQLKSRMEAAGGNTSQLEKCQDCRMRGRPKPKTGGTGV